MKHQPITKTICQLGFRCGQQSSQPATTASGFDRNATRNPQLHIVPSVVLNIKERYCKMTKQILIKKVNGLMGIGYPDFLLSNRNGYLKL